MTSRRLSITSPRHWDVPPGRKEVLRTDWCRANPRVAMFGTAEIAFRQSKALLARSKQFRSRGVAAMLPTLVCLPVATPAPGARIGVTSARLVTSWPLCGSHIADSEQVGRFGVDLRGWRRVSAMPNCSRLARVSQAVPSVDSVGVVRFLPFAVRAQGFRLVARTSPPTSRSSVSPLTWERGDLAAADHFSGRRW